MVGRVIRERRERRRELRSLGVGPDDLELELGELAGDEGEQLERRIVGSVQVVEHEQDRLRCARDAEKLPDRAEQRETVIGRGKLADSAQRLTPGPVRRRISVLPAAAPEDARAALLCTARELVRQPGLAHAGGSRDEKQPSPAGDRVVEPRKKLRQLGITAYERPRGAAPGPGARRRLHGGRFERRIMAEDRSLELT